VYQGRLYKCLFPNLANERLKAGGANIWAYKPEVDHCQRSLQSSNFAHARYKIIESYLVQFSSTKIEKLHFLYFKGSTYNHFTENMFEDHVVAIGFDVGCENVANVS